MQYRILSTFSDSVDKALSRLEDRVKYYIKIGYKPIGGVSIVSTVQYNQDSYTACQAMIKE